MVEEGIRSILSANMAEEALLQEESDKPRLKILEAGNNWLGSFQIDHLTLSCSNPTKRVKHAKLAARLKGFHLNYKYARPLKSINKSR